MYRPRALCFPCGNDRPTGNQPIAHEFCEAIGGHIYLNAGGEYICICNQACPTGSQFVGQSAACRDCSLVDKMLITTATVDRNHCLACTTTKRFWAGSYCYRCDTSEEPDIDVLNESEVASCTSCSQREVKDSQCVLKQ